MFGKQPNLFKDPQSDYPIHDLHLPFNDYIELTRSIIKETRQDLSLDPEQVISANAPFAMNPTTQSLKPRVGALLTHGLLDSTFLTREIATAFQQQGIVVKSILLPGHGTVPGALLNVQYADWAQAVRYGVAALKQEVDKIILFGFSTGATLSLLHAAENPELIDRIICISPAIKIGSPFAMAAHWLNMSWSDRWFHKDEELDYAKYTSLPINAIDQVYLLGKKMEALNSSAWQNIPMLFLMAHEDEIVSTRASLDFFQRNANSQSRVLLYSSTDFSSQDGRIELRSSRYPELRIKNFSHICLPFSPDNPHYGKHGDFIDSSHIDTDQATFGAADRMDEKISHLMHMLKLTRHPFKRLSFNPDFSYMINKIVNFITV